MDSKHTELMQKKFHGAGITVRQWASENGFPPYAVYQVLSGRVKATWGRAHQIAVALGMKPASAA